MNSFVEALNSILGLQAETKDLTCQLVKGTSDLVIKDGVVIPEAMRKNDLSVHDLMEDIRLNANQGGIENIKEAHIERNGQISVVK